MNKTPAKSHKRKFAPGQSNIEKWNRSRNVKPRVWSEQRLPIEVVRAIRAIALRYSLSPTSVVEKAFSTSHFSADWQHFHTTQAVDIPGQAMMF